jgi:hypothetical protein
VVAEEGQDASWRGIDALAVLVGYYGWFEWRLFEVAGAWAARSEGEAATRVWCAATARRHGELARRWAERLPVRAGVDAGALVRPPSDELAGAFERLGALDEVGVGTAVLVSTVLPRLAEVYRAHLATASPVREAAVAEVLSDAQRIAAGEASSERFVVRNLGDGIGPAARAGDLVTVFERAFDNLRVFPAVRAS